MSKLHRFFVSVKPAGGGRKVLCFPGVERGFTFARAKDRKESRANLKKTARVAAGQTWSETVFGLLWFALMVLLCAGRR